LFFLTLCVFLLRLCSNCSNFSYQNYIIFGNLQLKKTKTSKTLDPSVFPTIGVPLPFFSYGGSGLWGFTILLFIFIKMDANKVNEW